MSEHTQSQSSSEEMPTDLSQFTEDELRQLVTDLLMVSNGSYPSELLDPLNNVLRAEHSRKIGGHSHVTDHQHLTYAEGERLAGQRLPTKLEEIDSNKIIATREVVESILWEPDHNLFPKLVNVLLTEEQRRYHS